MVLRSFPVGKTGRLHLKPKNSPLSGPRPGIVWLLLVYPGACPWEHVTSIYTPNFEFWLKRSKLVMMMMSLNLAARGLGHEAFFAAADNGTCSTFCVADVAWTSIQFRV